MSAHPRIDEALEVLRLQFPTMPDAQFLDRVHRERANEDTRVRFVLSDGSEWMLVKWDLAADYFQIWRIR